MQIDNVRKKFKRFREIKTLLKKNEKIFEESLKDSYENLKKKKNIEVRYVEC